MLFRTVLVGTALVGLAIALVGHLPATSPAAVRSQTRAVRELPVSADNPFRLEGNYSGWPRAKAESAHRQFLVDQQEWEHEHRKKAVSTVASTAPRSFRARVEAFCRDNDPALGDRVLRNYRKTLGEEPETAEGEQQRQLKLRASEDLLVISMQNLQTCRSMVINGFQKLPEGY